jgi:hypothetical protein
MKSIIEEYDKSKVVLENLSTTLKSLTISLLLKNPIFISVPLLFFAKPYV